MGKALTEIEAAIRVRMSPALLRWFTSYAPKHGIDRKLKYTKKGEEYFYDSDELDGFNAFLQERWPIPKGQTRPPVPEGIQREIKIEANHKCAFCEYIAHGEGAHIDAVAKSGCNHPHNLIWTCPNHHTEYDHGLKVATVVKADHVKVMKEMLQDAKLRHLQIEYRAVAGLIALIEELEKIKAYLNNPEFADIKQSLEAVAQHVLNVVAEQAAKSEKADKKSKTAPLSANYKGYLKQIAGLIPASNSPAKTSVEKIVEVVVEATDEYLERDRLAKCPLCKGSGVHNRFGCHICAGEGTVSADAMDEIDLRPYKQVDCPLCEGSGTHNRFECPVCHGVGTVDQGALDEIDTRPYKQTECPLCEGSGTHNKFDCPVCHGVGTIDRRDEAEIDLCPFKQVDCPLCEGKGTRKGGFECSVCRGVGTIDRRSEDDLDLSPFKQVECPLCVGSRRHKGGECPVCRGDGEIDRGYADNIDLDMFRE